MLYAPDYVINAGGIINVSLEYLGQGDEAEVRSRIASAARRRGGASGSAQSRDQAL